MPQLEIGHILGALRGEMEIQHRLSIGLEKHPVVAHHHTVRALEPDLQRTEGPIDFGNACTHALQAATDPPQGDASFD